LYTSSEIIRLYAKSTTYLGHIVGVQYTVSQQLIPKLFLRQTRHYGYASLASLHVADSKLVGMGLISIFSKVGGLQNGVLIEGYSPFLSI
jgi:hypothetical protein